MAQLSGQLFRPRVVDGRTAAVGTRLARWLRGRTSGRIVVAGRTLDAVAVGAIRPDGVDPDAAIAAIHGGPDEVLAIGSVALVRGVAQLVLGGLDELAAPRAPTAAEQAVWALVVATAIDAIAPRTIITVVPSGAAGPLDGERSLVAIDVAVDGGVRGRAWLAVPPAFAPPAGLMPLEHAAWLDAVSVAAPVVMAHAALTPDEVDRLEPRDVIVVGRIDGAPDAAALRVGRGAIPVTLPDAADRVTVRAPYQRGRMDESLGDDLTVELAVSAGAVTVSARRLLELAPGEVLPLHRPAAGQVDLVVGQKVIGRGELLDVDGELAVRILAIHPR